MQFAIHETNKQKKCWRLIFIIFILIIPGIAVMSIISLTALPRSALRAHLSLGGGVGEQVEAACGLTTQWWYDMQLGSSVVVVVSASSASYHHHR